jgi:hypothetical protein
MGCRSQCCRSFRKTFGGRQILLAASVAKLPVMAEEKQAKLNSCS